MSWRVGTKVPVNIYKDNKIAGQCQTPELAAELVAAANEDTLFELLEAAAAYISAIETCHTCGASLLAEEGPAHCEDCGCDCDEHDPPACVGLDVLLARLKAATGKFSCPTLDIAATQQTSSRNTTEGCAKKHNRRPPRGAATGRTP
jgi:hypothetical protein